MCVLGEGREKVSEKGTNGTAAVVAAPLQGKRGVNAVQELASAVFVCFPFQDEKCRFDPSKVRATVEKSFNITMVCNHSVMLLSNACFHI